jgi:hypothetical protein
VGKTNGDGSLMPKVPSQTECPYCSNDGEVRLEIRRTTALSRTVVDKQDVKCTRIRRNGLIKPTNELCGRTPVVAERHKNYDIQRCWHDAGNIDGL